MRPIPIQGEDMMAVLHHGEPCTFRLIKKNYLRQKKKDDGVLPVLDSLDNYKMLSERMNVLTIYLPWGKIGIASNLSL